MEAIGALLFLAMFFAIPVGLMYLHGRIGNTGATSEELMRARFEARYLREENDIVLGVAKQIKTHTAQRVAAVFADRNYIDFLIARQMGLPNVQNAPAEPERPPVEVGRGGRGQTIPAGDYPPHRREYTEYETYSSRKKARKQDCPPSEYTPPQQWQARPQIPPPAFRPPYDDDGVLDVPALPVYPPALLAAPQQDKRKYASNAEKQRAYRECKKQQRY